MRNYKRIMIINISILILVYQLVVCVNAEEDEIAPWIESVEAENGVELLNGNGGLGQEYIESLTIRVYASDAGGSGLEKIIYYSVNQGVSSGESTVNLDSELSGTIIIKGEFQGSVYFKPIDRAGNQGESICVNNIYVGIKKEEDSEVTEEKNKEVNQVDFENITESEEEKLGEVEEASDNYVVEQDNSVAINDNIVLEDQKKTEILYAESTSDDKKNYSSNSSKSQEKEKTEETISKSIIKQIENDEIIYNIIDKKVSKAIKMRAAHKGSSFYLSENLKNAIDKNISEINDFKIIEENIDKVNMDSVKIFCSCNGISRKLAWPVNYKVEEGLIDNCNKYIYTLDDNIFNNDGLYELNIQTVDSCGNINQYEDKIKFIVDRVEPIASFLNAKDNQILAGEYYNLNIMIKDNIEIKSIDILLDGKNVDVDNDKDIYTISIKESNNKRNVSVKAEDMAGNVTYIMLNNIIVTSDPIVRFINNKKIMLGIILVIIGLLCIVVLKNVKQKKSEHEMD